MLNTVKVCSELLSVMTIILMKEHVFAREKKEMKLFSTANKPDCIWKRALLETGTIIIIIILLYDVANRHASLSLIRVSHVEKLI